jgi:hypothetical protein
MNRIHWTPADKAWVRKLYPTCTAQQLANRLGLRDRRKAIERLVHSLGLSKQPRLPAKLIEAVKRLHGLGLTDAAIARRLGQTRDRVHEIRYGRLKLPPNEAAVLEARRQGVKTQWKRLGIRSAGELRSWAFRRYAVECGWPPDLRPREVQILNVLAERGPLTRLELARAIGMRTDRIGCNGGPALLVGNSPGGTYTASLLHRGLILYVPRWVKGRPHGRARVPGVYMLTLEAIALLEKRNGQSHETRPRAAGGERGSVFPARRRQAASRP